MFIGSVTYFGSKEFLDILWPSMTKLVDCSLSEDVVPASFKKAVVTPLIKNLHYHLTILRTTDLHQPFALYQN